MRSYYRQEPNPRRRIVVYLPNPMWKACAELARSVRTRWVEVGATPLRGEGGFAFVLGPFSSEIRRPIDTTRRVSSHVQQCLIESVEAHRRAFTLGLEGRSGGSEVASGSRKPLCCNGSCTHWFP